MTLTSENVPKNISKKDVDGLWNCRHSSSIISVQQTSGNMKRKMCFKKDDTAKKPKKFQ